MPEVRPILVFPGAGSDGSSWKQVSHLTGAVVHPLQDSDSMDEIVEDARRVVDRLDVAPVLAGASLGAMVAIEVARGREVAGLVLTAAGWGITVSAEALALVSNPDAATMNQLVASGVAPARTDLHEARARDFAGRDSGVLHRHLTALASHQPEAVRRFPRTVVIHGAHDRSVGLGAHARLAAKCRGYLRSLPHAGHSAHLEDPHEVSRWMKYVAMPLVTDGEDDE